MDALVILLIYLVPFLVIGMVAKWLIGRWMTTKGATLSDVQA